MKKCVELKKFILEQLGAPLPEALEAHLQECAACRERYEEQLQIKQLISLKKFEEPRSVVEARGVSNIMREVRLSEEKVSENEARWLWLFSEPRYGLAMLLVIFLGLNILKSEDPSHGSTVTLFSHPANEQLPASMTLLSKNAAVETNHYPYPDLPEDPTAPWLQPEEDFLNKEGPVQFVSFEKK
jgi:predicted anti-sigma-YlaC factor YlaD